MHPIDVLSLDCLLIGSVASLRWGVLGHSPGPKDVGKPLAILANALERGLLCLLYPSMITWKPAIFGGYIELSSNQFLDHPISFREASEVGLERRAWTFIKKGRRFRVVNLTNDFSKLEGKCDSEFIKRVCKIKGRDLLQLSSVPTYEKMLRCFWYDKSVFLNSIKDAIDLAVCDPKKSARMLVKGGKAALQTLVKIGLREDFTERSDEFTSKYPFLDDANDFKKDPPLQHLKKEAIGYILFSNLTKAVFANQFGIGIRDGISTGKRLEAFLTGPQLPIEAWVVQEIYDSIEKRNLNTIEQAKNSVVSSDKENPGLEQLIRRTADLAVNVLKRERRLPKTISMKQGHHSTSAWLSPKNVREEIVVDGANFAFFRGRPDPRRLKGIIYDLQKRGFSTTVFVDRSVMRILVRQSSERDKAFFYKNVTVVPGGREADEYILDYADTNCLRVASGDLFRKYMKRFPWVSTRRVIKPALSPNKKVLSWGLEN